MGFIRYIKENWGSILWCILAGFALFPILFIAIPIIYAKNIKTAWIIYAISCAVITYNFIINFLEAYFIREDSRLKRFDRKVRYYLSAGTFYATTGAVVLLILNGGPTTKITKEFLIRILFSIVVCSVIMIIIINIVTWFAKKWIKKNRKMITIENIWLINLNNKK